MTFSASRARFLRGHFSSQRVPPRPPWARAEAEFIQQCSRCGDCLAACARGLIEQGSGGFPQVNFARGACTFCGDCARACRHGALAYAPRAVPWSLQAVVQESCLARHGVVCRSCGEQCEAGAIRFQHAPGRAARPEVVAGACSGCGACFAVCPAQAVGLRAGFFPQENCA